MMPFREIRTERLLLRQIRDADKPRVFEGLSRQEMIKYYGVSYKTLEETESQMEWYRRLWEENTGIWWAITLSGYPDDMIGAVGMYSWNHLHHNAEMGFWILPENQRKGFMKESGTAVLAYLFQNTNIHRVYALVEPENQPSLTLLETLGFTREGRQREVEWKEGRYIDLIWFSVLRHEFGA